MASTQVLKKQEHLEAGKRRLVEFRKKKAAERAKKGSSSQQKGSDVSSYEKQPLEAEHGQITDSEGIGTSDGPGGEPSGLINNGKNAIGYDQKSDQGSSNEQPANSSVIANNYNTFSANLVQTRVNDIGFKRYDASGFAKQVNNDNSQETRESDGFGTHTKDQRSFARGTTADQTIDLHVQSSTDTSRSSSQSSIYEMEESHSKESMSAFKDPTVTNPAYFNAFITKNSPQNSVSTLPQTEPNNASMLASGRASSPFYEDSIEPTASVTALEIGQNMNGKVELNGSVISNLGEGKLSSPISNFWSVDSLSVQKSEYFSSRFSSDVKSSTNHVPLYSAIPETKTRRSRPSFIDSFNVSRASSATLFPHSEAEEASNSSNLKGIDTLGSSASYKSITENESTGLFSKPGTQYTTYMMNSLVSDSNVIDPRVPGVNENIMKKKPEFYSWKNDDDFSAFEQHIQELTQKKFSLQRALEASQTLAESLAAENSSLTDSYNQQRSVVNQLKSDMENLQEEIKALLVELKSVKIKYESAQLECNATDERAKLLASEVIGLEEKALRLRSSELKLERQLENSHAELTSCKKKLSSLDIERQDSHLTIDALQEEKKMLQSKLQKAASSGKSIDISKSPIKDVSTSTEDLANEDTTPDTSNQEGHTVASILGSDASGFPLPESGQSLDVSSVNIPSEHTRMIQNITELISELALEKEELMQALASESAQCFRMKDVNKELSCKLESQTQRLELLTAQSMANENIPARLSDSRILPDHAAYADEGDEVVDRVLGWIMKLFPGGPSRRRTSKLL